MVLADLEAQPAAMIHVRLFWRGALIVFLTALNVGQIAGRHYGGAFLGGCAISFVWYMNSRTAAHSTARFGREAYALGAGIGTVLGMAITQWLYG